MIRLLLSFLLQIILLCSVPQFRGETVASEQGTQPDVVKVGLVAPFSGKGDWMGEQILRGVQHAFAMQSGDLEVDVRLSIEDSQGDPVRAATAVQRLGEDSEVMAIIGPALSESAIESALPATRMRVPTISPTAMARGITGLSPYLFRNSMTVGSMMDQLVDHITRKMGILTFSVLYPLNSTGIRLYDEFEKSVEDAGGRIIYSFSFPPESTDFGEIMKKMGGAVDKELPDNKPLLDQFDDLTLPMEYQALLLLGDATSTSLIAPSLTYYNITGVQTLGTNRWGSREFLSLSGGYIEGAVFVDGFFADSLWPQVADFVSSFKRAFGETPGIIAAQSYDAASIILRFIRSGIRSREDMKEALLRLKEYPGVSGYTTILPSGDSVKELFILTVEDGKIVQLN